MPDRLPHGTIIEFEASLPVRGHDRRGILVFEAKWDGSRLVAVKLRLPDGRHAVVEAGAGRHPLFGRCDTVSLADGPVLARFQAVDWADPANIPPLDRPGVLPSGAGTAILNLLAQQAQRQGRTALRYRGPYPTGSLFDALTDCFQPQGELAAAFERFTERVEEAATHGEMVEPPIDFVPAPFERVWFEAGVCVQLRDGVEKIFVDGRAYARHIVSARQVRQTDEGFVAVVEIGGAPWTERGEFDRQGNLLAGPNPLPPVNNRFVGQPLPDRVRAVLTETLPPRAPRLMQTTLHRILAQTPIEWGDAGDDVAVIRNGTIILHAVLLERLEGRPPAEILMSVAQAVEPVAQRLAQAALARVIEPED